MTHQELQGIIKLVSQSPIQKFEFSDETTRILIEKASSTAKTIKEVVHVEERAQPKVEMISSEASDAVSVANLQEVVSPMVGTFYSSSEQGSAPFVQIGDKIGPKTVVCILEAMKLFTEIAAKVSGEIVEVLVEDGQLVEYGQPLFLVKPE